MSELKACPFCGREAKSFYDDNGDHRSTWHWIVECNGCGVTLSGPLGQPSAYPAIAAWNRRAGGEAGRAALALLLDEMYGLHARPGHAALILSKLAALRATPGGAGPGGWLEPVEESGVCPKCKRATCGEFLYGEPATCSADATPAIVETYEKVREAYEESKGETDGR